MRLHTTTNYAITLNPRKANNVLELHANSQNDVGIEMKFAFDVSERKMTQILAKVDRQLNYIYYNYICIYIYANVMMNYRSLLNIFQLHFLITRRQSHSRVYCLKERETEMCAWFSFLFPFFSCSLSQSK